MEQRRQKYQMVQKGLESIEDGVIHLSTQLGSKVSKKERKKIDAISPDSQEFQMIERELAAIADSLKGITIEKPKDGYTPIKGVDYIDGITPVKGIDYFTKKEQDAFVKDILSRIKPPKDGKDATPVDYTKVKDFIKKEISKIPKPDPVETQVIDTESIIQSVLEKIPAQEPIVIDYPSIEKYCLEEIQKIENERDQRWVRLNSGGPTTRLGELVDVEIGGLQVGQVLKWNGSQWVPGNDTGSTAFTTLTDTPNSYSSQASKYVSVKSDETGLEFTSVDLSGYVPYTGATADVNIGTHTYIGHAIKGDASDGIYIKANNDTNIGLLGAGNTANVTWYGNHNFDLATQDTIAGFLGSGKTLSSLSTSTYPSLIELSYVKGVTSAIQTQLDAKLGITTGAVSTSYTNVGGSGNRKALITVTTTITSLNGTPDYLVNGNTADNFFYWAGQTASGKYLRFDFGSGNKFVINEAKWYQDLSTSQGVWQWQGSNDASSWTNIGSTFTLGGVATQTQTELSANTTAYRYYQLLGVSGSLSGAPYDQEIEFKISTAITGTTADVTGRLYLQSNGNPLEVGGMAVFNAGIIYNSRPLISSQWQTSGSSIYYPVTGDSGDVGFGRVPTSGYRVDIEKIGRVVSSTSNQPAQFYWRNSSGNSAEFRIDSAVAPTLGIASAFHLLLSNANTGFIIDDGTTERYRFQRDGLFGIGSGANTVTKLHVIGTDTTNGQWRFGYDNSNYFKGVISATGGVTFDAFGSGASFTFSDPVTINGLLTLSAQNIATDTSTGMKIGTSTSQKLSLWNATPNVQPTTAITASTFVANTSGIVDDSATWGGYTVGQVVAALKQIGLLA